MSSNLPKSLLSTATNSSGEQVLANFVNPTISAYKILHIQKRRRRSISQSHTMTQSKFARRHNRADVTVTWRLCADGCRGCGNCGSWILSSRCTRAWTVSLSLPFSAPQRCSVATLTGGAAPVTMDAGRTRGGWAETLAARLICLSYRGEGLPTKVVHEPLVGTV